MRFGIAHRISTDALSALGVLATISAGVSAPVVAAIIVVATACAIAAPERWRARVSVRWSALAAAVAVVGLEALRAAAGAPMLACLIETTAALLVVRIATRQGAANDREIAVLSFAGAALAGVVGAGLVYVALLLALLVLAPGALLLSHLRREVEGNYRQGARDRTGMPVDVPRILRSKRVIGRELLAATIVLGLATVAAGVAAFVALPRVGLGLFGLETSNKPFADRIDLSSRDVPDDAVALRFTPAVMPDVPPTVKALRFRGAVLDTFDGVTWSRSTGDFHSSPAASHDARGTKLTIDREPAEPPVVLVPAGMVAIDTPVPMLRAADGELRFAAARGRAVRYDVWIGSGPPTSALAPPAPALSVPLAHVSTRVRALAHQWADPEPTPRGKADAIERHLRGDFAYDLVSSSRGAPDALDDFLFVTRRGHCELFATAAAVMLREVGVPSRVVTGFVGGTYNRFGGFYTVRNSSAHAWVEGFVDGAWITLDATPTTTRAATPVSVARELAEAVARRGGDEPDYPLRWLALAALVALVLAPALLRTKHERSIAALGERAYRASRASGAATKLYEELEAALASRGLARAASLPPLRHAEQLAARRHPLGPEIVALTRVYLEARFGGAELTDSARRDFARRVRRLREDTPVSISGR